MLTLDQQLVDSARINSNITETIGQLQTKIIETEELLLESNESKTKEVSHAQEEHHNEQVRYM